MEQRRLKIAMYQHRSDGHPTKSDNISLIKNILEKVRSQNVDLLVLPELFLTGYNIGTDNTHNSAETFDGPSFVEISKLAKLHDIAIVYGYPEIVHNGSYDMYLSLSSFRAAEYYNSAMLINSFGERVINYRKTHLWYSSTFKHEVNTFINGNGLGPVVSIKGIKIGLLICWDIEFPEPARVLSCNRSFDGANLFAVQGAELIVVPTANNDPKVSHFTVPTRSMENQVFVCYCNLCQTENGKSYAGVSVITSPDGTFLQKADNDCGLFIADIFPDDPAFLQYKQDNPVYINRKPSLYSAITQSSPK